MLLNEVLDIIVLWRTIQTLFYAEEVDLKEKHHTEMICCSFSKFQKEPYTSCQESFELEKLSRSELLTGQFSYWKATGSEDKNEDLKGG